MYIVTGGCGFIGSNLVSALNLRGVSDILVVDDLTESGKFANIRDCRIADYMDAEKFLRIIESNSLDSSIEAIFHQGACADTMETNGRYMMENNYEYSKSLLNFAAANNIPFVYASSASVYGNNRTTTECRDNEMPLNVYAYSKLLFDGYVQRNFDSFESTVVGLRYFNVYGPNEFHKGRMASMVYQAYHQLESNGFVKLFEGTDGYGDGDQRRDFVFVGDVANVNLFFGDGPVRKGVLNVGTGESRSFNDLANILISLMERGEIKYIPFPEELRGKYQSFTEADVARLRDAGYEHDFTSLEQGIAQYVKFLQGRSE